MLNLRDIEEYDHIADWCAVKGLTGDIGCELPDGISVPVHDAINYDSDAFMQRVRDCAYARARMNRQAR